MTRSDASSNFLTTSKKERKSFREKQWNRVDGTGFMYSIGNFKIGNNFFLKDQFSSVIRMYRINTSSGNLPEITKRFSLFMSFPKWVFFATRPSLKYCIIKRKKYIVTEQISSNFTVLIKKV